MVEVELFWKNTRNGDIEEWVEKDTQHYHRDGAPAVIYPEGQQCWFQHGVGIGITYSIPESKWPETFERLMRLYEISKIMNG